MNINFSINVKALKLFAVTIIAMSFFCIGCVHDRINTLVDTQDNAYSKVAVQFIEIINNKDVERLVQLGLPDDREELKSALTDNTSSLHAAFLGKNKSIRSFIRISRKLSYEIIDYPQMPEYKITNIAKIIDVILYDKDKIKGLKGMKLEDVNQLISDNEIFVFAFMKPLSGHEPPGYIEGQWYMDFTGHPFIWMIKEDDVKRAYPFQ